MRIAYVLGTYPQPSETFIAREIEGLRARGHHIDIFSLFVPESGPAPGVTYGWQTPMARLMRKFGGAAASRALGRTWETEFTSRGCEIIMAHFGSLPSTVALEAGRRLPIILSLHARDIYVEAERLDDKLTHATAAITCTRENVDYLRTHFPTAAPRISLVYHGLPRAWLESSMPGRPRKAGEPLRILATGRMVEKKGFHVLLEACAALAGADIPFTLRFIGDGPMLEQLRRQVHRLNLDSMVTFQPWGSPEEIKTAYAWADIFCCPSILAADGDRDGLPNVLVEAMSSGLPAIGSNLSGIPEAIEDEVTGMLVTPGDVQELTEAIKRCADPRLRMRLGVHAAASVREKFDAENWLDVLEDILSKRDKTTTRRTA